MCGRYTHLYTWAQIHDLLSVIVPGEDLPKRHNVAPSQKAPIIRVDPEGNKRAEQLRWGLVPSWAKDLKVGYQFINARGESVGEKPAFRASFKARRCLVPASGFYEWQKGEGSTRKQPYYFTRKTEEPFAFAGLWDRCVLPSSEIIESYAIITTEANSVVSPVHERMPVIIAAADYDKWLNKDTPPAELSKLLKPCPPDFLTAYPVSLHVNSPKNDDSGCCKRASD